jgi:diguanylate cyclase (GGDEF)-like protein
LGANDFMTESGMRPRRAEGRAFGRYAVVVTVAGAAAAFAAAAAGGSVPIGDWRFWLFAALVLLAELKPIDVARRDGLDRVTVSSAFAFAALLLFGLVPAMLAHAAASVAADASARLAPLKLAFNAAQYGLSLAAAGLVLALLGHGDETVAVGEALPAVAAAGLTFLVVNHVLAGVAAALLVHEPVVRYLLTDLRFQVMSAGFVLALGPVVAASAEASIALAPLCGLPLLAIHIGARQAARDAHRALHDVLTGLPNRLLLAERLEAALREARAGGGTVTLMIVDLDDFKAVNDTLGHAHGDRLLQDVAARLREALAPWHVLARLGGDEFAVLLGRAGRGDGAAGGSEAGVAVANRLVAALEEPFTVDGIALDVRASVGVASFPEHGTGADELLRSADVALYCAKEAERPVEVYAAAHDHHSVDRLMLAGQLRRGIEMGEILLEYQPKFRLSGGEAVGVEALARWQHPALGRVGPDGFIPLAEQAGLINALTAVVLREAIQQCARWRAEGLALRVAVNVSPRSLVDRDLPRMIGRLLDASGVPPQSLQLEITESRAMPSGHGPLAVLDELRTMGVSVAIDDFGTGYSSLVQLQRLPVDEIKIDRSFVANMADSASDAAIVRSTIDLARNLGLLVCAEGVESEDARAQLESMGCELAQGYGLCRPLPADQCAEALREPAQAIVPAKVITLSRRAAGGSRR